MRRILSLLLCLVMLFSLTVPTFAAERPIRIKLCNYTDPSDNWVGEKWVISKNDVKAFKKEHPNAKYIVSDTEAVIKKERTMVPVRVIAEELGYEVTWNYGNYDINLTRFSSNSSGYNSYGYKYYKNYNQFSKFINLFYRLEGGKVDRFKDFHTFSTTYNAPISIGGMTKRAEMFVYSIDFNIGEKKGYIEMVADTFDGYDLSRQHFARATYTIDSPAYIDKQNRTMIPLRAMGEMMGLSVSWDNANRVVTISA